MRSQCYVQWVQMLILMSNIMIVGGPCKPCNTDYSCVWFAKLLWYTNTQIQRVLHPLVYAGKYLGTCCLYPVITVDHAASIISNY